MKHNRTQKSAINAAVAVAAQCLSLLLSFVARTVFIANMQREYLGIGGLFSNILTVLSLAELGIGDALVYALYKPMKEQNREELKQLIGFAKRVYHIMALVVAAIGIAVSFFLNDLIKEAPDVQEDLRLIFYFYLANSVCSYLLAYKSLVLTADQCQYITSLVSQGAKILQQILQMLVLMLFHSFYLYLACQIFCTVLNNVVVLRIINKRYPYLKERSKGRLPKEKLNGIGKDVASLSVSKISGVVANGTDNIIISKMIGLVEVGLASNYSLIINAVNGILWQGIRSLMGSIGNFNVDSTLEHRRSVFDQLQLLSYWLYAMASVCVIVLAGPFVELCWGAEFLLDGKTVFAMMLVPYVGGVNFAAYSFRATMGEFSKIKYFHLAAGILNLVVSVAVAPSMGLFGVFLATSVTRIFTSELMDGYLVAKKILGKSFWWYAGKYLLLFGVFIVDLMLTGMVVRLIGFTGITGLLVKGAVCVLCSNGILLAVFGRTAAFKNLLVRTKSLFFRKK